MIDQLTVVVPTRNRNQFLRRLLFFFAQRNLSVPILISDSSDRDVLVANQSLVKEFDGKLKITHRHTELDLTSKIIEAIDLAETPQLVFCADDDFLLPESLETCVNFLNDNPSYSCVSGVWIQVESERSGRSTQIRCDQIDQESSVDRFRKYSSNWFSNFYAVHRKSDLARAWRVTRDSTDADKARIYTEWLLSQLSVVYGKFAVLPQVHYIFQLHLNNCSSNVPLVADGASANEMYDRFEQSLAEALALDSGIPIEQCKKIVHGQYGHCRTGTILLRDHRPSGWRRYALKLRQRWALMQDRVTADPVKVRMRRRLKEGSLLLQSDSWLLAHQLVIDFPDGMDESGMQGLLASCPQPRNLAA